MDDSGQIGFFLSEETLVAEIGPLLIGMFDWSLRDASN